MFNYIVAFCVFLFLFISMYLSVALGRMVGRRQLAQQPNKKLEVISVAEGAVFALLGLLIAFTYSSAFERFEARKMYIIQEANAIEEAWLNVGLVVPAEQATLKKDLREYLIHRINMYHELFFLKAANERLDLSEELQDRLWNDALRACQLTNVQATTLLLLPSLNKVFDIANTRVAITQVHTPILIFLLLFLLSVFSSFLAGYSTASSKQHSMYIFIYVLITAFTLYVIVDLEVPRVGLIRVDRFDFVLENLVNTLK